MKIEANVYAFHSIVNFEELPSSAQVEYGLTKREYFAAMAMQGICANNSGYKIVKNQPDYTGKNSNEIIARLSVEMSDALIAELTQP